MPACFNALPGMEVPVGAIARGFDQLWAEPSVSAQKALQLNLVLHLGVATTPTDAVEQFAVAQRFAQRYPCRVVVLCPTESAESPLKIRAKIYGECFFGKSKDDTRCVEFVALSYPPAAKAYLQDQVSVCLSTDLPLYYWAHRFVSSKRMSDYQYLLTRAQRVMFDRAIVSPDALSFAWPNISAVRDLAYTRTLALRQNLGQYLSRYAPELIITGLRQVTIRHRGSLSAEANCLLHWVKKGLGRSGWIGNSSLAFNVEPLASAGSLSLEFTYATSGKIFHWTADLDKDCAEFTSDLGTGPSTQIVGAHLLSPELALSEAMFY